MSETVLEIKDLTKIYKDKKQTVYALDGVSLSIRRGETLSLLGVNGAGKTTLSSILATLHPPTSGDVLFNGSSIYKDITSYRKFLGFCPQKPNLDPYLNVEENLLFAGRYFLMPEDKVKERVAYLLKEFSLEKYREFEISSLSGGNKQRVLIARSLIHSPDIIILDEPTVGLDPDIRRQLWNVIKGLREKGVTVILTTHYLDEAEVLSDRVCVISHGKIILTETVAELKKVHKKETLEEIFLDLTKEEQDH